MGEFVGDHALELNRIEAAQKARGHDQVRTPGVTTQRTCIGDIVLEHVELGHGQTEGGAESVGDVEQTRVLVLLDQLRTDPRHRHRRGGAPEAVHEGSADDEEGDDAEDDVHRHPQQHPDQDGRDNGAQGTDAYGAAPVRGNLARRDLGRAQARLLVDRWRSDRGRCDGDR